MTLEGANVFFDATDYTIYAMNSTNTGRYCVVLPKNNNGNYNMLVDLHMKNAFDNVTNGSKTKDQLIEEIKTEYTGVKSKYNDGILVIPMIDENLYSAAVINNDKQKMFDKVKKIGAITSEVYKKLTESGIDKQKIDQKIIIIIKNNDDIKFVDWLKEQMPNFVIGINETELKVVDSNPFMVGANPFMPETAVVNDIFGAPATQAQSSPVTTQNDLFSQTTNIAPQPNVAQPTNDIFNTPNTTTENVVPQPQPTPVAETQITQTPVANTAPVVEQAPPTPTPVQSTPLEATTTMQPVQDSSEGVNGDGTNSTIPEKKGSKGFTNLLILLVILGVVTVVSIELGKFLYNTYGV